MEEKNVSCNFDQITLRSFEQTPCSPVFEDFESEGIKINMPERIELEFGVGGFAEDARFPICITARFKGSYANKFDDIIEAMNIIMSEENSSNVYTGRFIRDLHIFDRATNPELESEEFQQTMYTEYANINILDFIKLPAHEAIYYVYIALENHKSNVCKIWVCMP